MTWDGCGAAYLANRPDADRLRLREAIQKDDLSAMLELAAPENLSSLPPGSIWVLSATLWDRYPERRPDVYRMYDQALYLYPNDYVLQSVGAMIYRMVGRKEATLACRTAAFSLQPENAQARYDLADSLFFAGRMVDALGVYLACTARSPDSAPSWNGLGWTQLQLGDFAGAAVSFKKATELDANPLFLSDLQTARYLAGVGTKAAMEDLARSSVVVNEALNYCVVLADAPDAERRNPELAIARVRDPQFAEVYQKAGAVVETLAKVHLQDYQGALEALQQFDPKSDYLVLSPLVFPFLRALIYARLGQQGTARECYARGMEGWSQLVGNEEGGWERSDVKRWRTAAEQALGL